MWTMKSYTLYLAFIGFNSKWTYWKGYKSEQACHDAARDLSNNSLKKDIDGYKIVTNSHDSIYEI